MDLVRDLQVRIDPTGAKAGAAQATAAFGQVGRSARDMEQSSKKAQGAIASLSGALGFLKTLVAGIGFGLFIRDLYQTDTAMVRLQLQLKAASGSAAEFQKNFNYLRSVASKLGLDLRQTGDAFGQFVASAKGKLSGAQIRETFTSISEASTALGLSADQTSGTIVALSQMLSKGTVASQELKMQLGNALPGAFQLAAQAMGRTEKEMNKALDTGTIMADELVPKLAKKLHEVFGPAAIDGAKTLQAEMNRLKTAWTEFQMVLMGGGGEALFGGFITSAKRAIDQFKTLVAGLFEANNEGRLSEAIAASLRIGIGKAANYFGGFVKIASEMVAEIGRHVFTNDYFTSLLGSFQSVAASFGLALLEALRKPIAALEAAAKHFAGVSPYTRQRDDIMRGDASAQIRSGLAPQVTSGFTAEQMRIFNSGDYYSGALGNLFVNNNDQRIVREAAQKLDQLVSEEQQRRIAGLNASTTPYTTDQLYQEILSKPQSFMGNTIEELKQQNQQNLDYYTGELFKKTGDAAIAALDKAKNFKPSKIVDTSADENLIKGFASRSPDPFAKPPESSAGTEQTIIKQKTLMDEFRRGIDEAASAMRNMFDQAYKAGTEVTQAMSNGFTSFFDAIIDNTDSVAKAFTKMTASILRDIAKIIAQRMIAEPIAGAIMGGLGGILGSLPSATTSAGTTLSASTSLFHSGGVVGVFGGSQKIVDASTFSHAPRFHNGLKPDEFPAILQRGEEVVPANRAGRDSVTLSMPITVQVDGSKGGTPEQNQRMGEEIASQLESMVDSRIAMALRPRGVLNRTN